MVDGGRGLREGRTHTGDGRIWSAMHFGPQISAVCMGQDQHVFANRGRADGHGRARGHSRAGAPGALAHGRRDVLERARLCMARHPNLKDGEWLMLPPVHYFAVIWCQPQYACAKTGRPEQVPKGEWPIR